MLFVPYCPHRTDIMQSKIFNPVIEPGEIIEPFFTTKPALRTGTALGQSLAYDIIKGHGGERRVDVKEHEETTFIKSLPCSA